MSVNWVMLSPDGAFVKLPNERILYTAPPRTSLELKTPSGFPGKTAWTVYSAAGSAHITNQRLVYIPKEPSPAFQSFHAPILHLQDTCVRSPIFGANHWTALVKPVAGGNIPASLAYVELKMVFSDGGAFDHHAVFEQIKERAAHALEMAREARADGGLDMADVHLEQLPAYEATGASGPPGVVVSAPGDEAGRQSPGPASRPIDPPPGYEEAQAQAVGIDLDARLRGEAEHS